MGMVARACRCCETLGGMPLDEAFPLAEQGMMSRLEQILGLVEDDEDPDRS